MIGWINNDEFYLFLNIIYITYISDVNNSINIILKRKILLTYASTNENIKINKNLHNKYIISQKFNGFYYWLGGERHGSVPL